MGRRAARRQPAGAPRPLTSADANLVMDNKLIYDVGMNNGDDTAYYLFKGYRVVAIEADPTLVDKARYRFAAEIDQGRLALLNVAVGPEERLVPFWICEGRNEWNSFDRANAAKYGQQCHALDVQCTRFRNILGEHGVPHYLKIDIEGHDHYCLADLDPDDLPRYVSLELSRLEDLAALSELGYNAFKVINQHDHTQFRFQSLGLKAWLKLKLQKRPRLSRAFEALGTVKGRLAGLLSRGSPTNGGRRRAAGGWEFPFGSSGPFGEETDGEWQTLEEAAYCWLNFRRLGDIQYGPESRHVLWFDVHATKL
jgi:FkbM family methyltransferase